MTTYDSISTTLQTNPHTWLVTGAAGFIGSHLADRLLSLGQKVIGLDNFITGRTLNIDFLAQHPKAPNFRFIEGDIRSEDDLAKAFVGVDFVLHQAALGSVPRSIEDPFSSHDSNVNGFLRILNMANDHKVKRFVYASSSSVYGDNETLPKVEGDEGRLLSPYAATKQIDEIYANTFFNVYQMPVVGLRYFNVFGPRQDPNGPYAAVIPKWIETLKNEEVAYINGDGSYSRDFCYVENVIQANILAAFAEKTALGKVYNIALGDRTTLLELHAAISKHLEAQCPGLKVPGPQHRDFRSGDIPHSLANIDMAKNYLGYQPKVKIEDGLKLTVEAYLKN